MNSTSAQAISPIVQPFVRDETTSPEQLDRERVERMNTTLAEMRISDLWIERVAAELTHVRAYPKEEKKIWGQQAAYYTEQLESLHRFAESQTAVASDEPLDFSNEPKAKGLIAEAVILTSMQALSNEGISIKVPSAQLDARGVDFVVEVGGKRYFVDVTSSTNSGLYNKFTHENRVVAYLPLDVARFNGVHVEELDELVKMLLSVRQNTIASRDYKETLHLIALYNLAMLEQYVKSDRLDLTITDLNIDFWEAIEKLTHPSENQDSL